MKWAPSGSSASYGALGIQGYKCNGCTYRITGELSRDLETAQGARTELLPDDRKKSKSETLSDAGIPTSTAHEYEQLAEAFLDAKYKLHDIGVENADNGVDFERFASIKEALAGGILRFSLA